MLYPSKTEVAFAVCVLHINAGYSSLEPEWIQEMDSTPILNTLGEHVVE